MILYNVTLKLDPAIHEDWLEWMRSVHIPEVLATGFFIENKVMRLLEPSDEDGYTYAIQYFCETIELLRQYQRECSPALQASHTERYRGKFVAFRTIMEVV